ncbi:MAG: hypothetical protein LPK02_07190 [Rhodobacterales bacterium]|nr:hypothetical protein [Rhodobacterales bacterium]
MRDLDFLNNWPVERLEALYRVAKRTPFFKHPRDMMALRSIVQRKRASKVVTLAPKPQVVTIDSRVA